MDLEASNVAPVAGEPPLGDDAVVTFEPFVAFYERAWARLVRLAVTIIEDRALAEDVVQEAFARTFLAWPTIVSPDLYVRRCVVNRCRSELRRRTVRRRKVVDEHVAAGRPATVDTPDGDDSLLRALRALTPRRRAVVALRYFDDLSEPQIATALGMRLGTVKSTLHAALAELRKDLEP